MRKPTICICENKDADQLCGNRELISAFVFATWIEQYLYFRPGQKLHSRFSHISAHILTTSFLHAESKKLDLSDTKAVLSLCRHV